MGFFALLKWIIHLDAATFEVEFINALLYQNSYVIQDSLIFFLKYQTL